MIKNLKDKIVLSDEIKKYITLKKRGNAFWSCCPFHNEKTASFVVNDEKNFFYCFGCGMAGDVFKFYKEFVHKDFDETLEILGKSYGFITKINKKQINELESMEKILTMAQDFYRNSLQSNQKALEYLKNRNFSEGIIEKFKLGFAPESKVVDHLLQKNFSMDIIKKAGIASYDSRDRFRNRIIFPIISKSQQVIGFSGRVFLEDEHPKYLNSPENLLFQKSLHVYNENNLINGLPTIIVEGYTDVITLFSLDKHNVVGSMGTSLTSAQVVSVFKKTNEIILMFDGDVAGQTAIIKSIKVIHKVLKGSQGLFICVLPKNSDPDSIMNNDTHKPIEYFLKHKVHILEWMWNYFLEGFRYLPSCYTRLFDEVDEFLLGVSNKNVRKTYKLFFDQKIFQIKKQKPSFLNSGKIVNMEDVFFNIILKKPDVVEFLIEDLSMVTFQEKTYNKIAEDIMELLITKEISPEGLKEFLLKKYNRFLEKVLKQDHFSYIICHKGFTINYLRDILKFLNNLSNSKGETNE